MTETTPASTPSSTENNVVEKEASSKLNLLPELISTIPCMNCGKPANKIFTCPICKALVSLSLSSFPSSLLSPSFPFELK